jgi:hypothetical protein
MPAPPNEEEPICAAKEGTDSLFRRDLVDHQQPGAEITPTRPPAENTAEKQRVRQQMLARNWHDDAISPELGSFCQKSHLIAGLIDLS